MSKYWVSVRFRGHKNGEFDYRTHHVSFHYETENIDKETIKSDVLDFVEKEFIETIEPIKVFINRKFTVARGSLTIDHVTVLANFHITIEDFNEHR